MVEWFGVYYIDNRILKTRGYNVVVTHMENWET